MCVLLPNQTLGTDKKEEAIVDSGEFQSRLNLDYIENDSVRLGALQSSSYTI